ncbi:hypothetical protein T12_1611, partial [Trichinella patagoniensis]
LGMLNCYNFLANKSHPSEALHRLLDKEQYDDQLPVILTCDRSPHGVVCVLAHELLCGREKVVQRSIHEHLLRRSANTPRLTAKSIEMNVSDLEPFEPPPNLTSPEVAKAYKDFDIAIHRMKEDMHRAIKSQMADASGSDGRNETRECSGRRTADLTPVKCRKRAKDKEKKIIFELCQKSFELRQVHGNYSLYRLSRIWMYGNDEPRHVNKAGNETTEEEPIDGVAQTRAAELEKSDASLIRKTEIELFFIKVKWNERNTEIYSLPPPSPSTSPISRIPPTVVMNETDDADVDLSTPQRILQSYLPHWKEVKKAWLRQSRLADRPYQKSLDMLKSIAAGILFVCQTCEMIRNGDERKVYKVVLTGGPCSGKTTGQEFLASFFEAIGWKVFRVPELATIIGGARFNELNEEQVMRFQENLLLTLLRLEDSFMSLAETCGENCLVICDRGAMDGSAYLNREAWEEILRRNNLNPIVLRDQRYNQIVHLVSGTVCGRGDTAYGRGVMLFSRSALRLGLKISTTAQLLFVWKAWKKPAKWNTEPDM